MIKTLDSPVLHVKKSTHAAMEQLQFFTPKLTIDDKSRVNQAIAHYEEYIDFDLLLDRIKID